MKFNAMIGFKKMVTGIHLNFIVTDTVKDFGDRYEVLPHHITFITVWIQNIFLKKYVVSCMHTTVYNHFCVQ